jgi:hypothetical protein
MKLGAYKINNTPVSDMQSVNVADLNGKAPYVIAEKLPTGYKDITSIENLHTYGRELIGSNYGFKDWKCLQQEVKNLVTDKTKGDLTANWNKLSAKEKLIASKYLLTKITPSALTTLVPNAQERQHIAMEYDLHNRKARGNASGGTGRIQVARLYLFEKLGAQNAFEVLSDIIVDRLFEFYESGIEGTEENGRVGINDYLQARKKTPYTTTGLKKRKYKIIDGSAETLSDVADKLTAILSHGHY